MTMNKKSLQTGVNLGGWLSQYPAYDLGYFDTFITDWDIRRIKDWDFDHVRLPIDYPLLENEHQPFSLNERGLGFVQRGLDWCSENGLQVILDLHKAPGFSFNNYQAATLFDDVSQQERFLNLWQILSEHFLGTSDFVAFELLNEVVLPDSAPWNRLIRKAVDLIRQVDTERLIVIGGNYYNAASQLARLDVLADPNILYTFHYYEPIIVTHQKATWIKSLLDYNKNVDYPGEALQLDEFLKLHPEYRDFLGRFVDRHLDRSSLQVDVQPAIDFGHITGQAIYCGEYGVIERAPIQTRLNWTRDFVSILREKSIGRAVWSYKGIDFGLVNLSGEVISNELIKIVSTP